MYKVLVLRNKVNVPIEDDFSRAIDYFKKRNINISFDFKDVDVPVSIKPYSKIPGSNTMHYGIEDSVKDACDKFAEKGKYHAVCFTWNTDDVKQPADGIITSWTNWSPLSWAKADTEFIQLITNDHNDKIDWIYKSICHEIMHTLCKRLNRRGRSVVDEMDETILKDGTKIPYYMNHDPDFDGGNYSHTFENLAPHIDVIYDFYFMEQEKKRIVYKQGDRNSGVSQLQRDLKQLGYFKYPIITGFFGSVTRSAVVAFQRANGLVADGIAGFMTLQKIEELKKKPKDFGLRPLVFRTASTLIAIMGIIGKPIRITEGLRTNERQTELYRQGRETPGKIVTNAKAGESLHNYGVAFDVVFVNTGYEGDWETLGKIGRALGLEWGGDFKGLVDKPHFEMKLGKTLSDFRNNKVDYTQYN